MDNMKRVIWVAVTILLMIGILGFGLHTLQKIDESNKLRREREEAEQAARQIIAATTDTTSVWDKMRASEAAANAAAETGEDGQPVAAEDPSEALREDDAAPAENDPHPRGAIYYTEPPVMTEATAATAGYYEVVPEIGEPETVIGNAPIEYTAEP